MDSLRRLLYALTAVYSSDSDNLESPWNIRERSYIKAFFEDALIPGEVLPVSTTVAALGIPATSKQALTCCETKGFVGATKTI